MEASQAQLQNHRMEAGRPQLPNPRIRAQRSRNSPVDASPISMGGTSILFTCITLGIILSVSNDTSDREYETA